jgi:adenylate kinase family enzyme
MSTDPAQYPTQVKKRIANNLESIASLSHELLDIYGASFLRTDFVNQYPLGHIASPPGGGKGTLVKWLTDFTSNGHGTYETLAFSGELGNYAIEFPSSSVAKEWNYKVAKGLYVLDADCQTVFLTRVQPKLTNSQGKGAYLLDGFPRTPQQAQFFLDQGNTFDFVVYMGMPDSVAVSRQILRGICSLLDKGIAGLRADIDTIPTRMEEWHKYRLPLQTHLAETTPVDKFIHVDGTRTPYAIAVDILVQLANPSRRPSLYSHEKFRQLDQLGTMTLQLKRELSFLSSTQYFTDKRVRQRVDALNMALDETGQGGEFSLTHVNAYASRNIPQKG